MLSKIHFFVKFPNLIIIHFELHNYINLSQFMEIGKGNKLERFEKN
jgi:hypothetical protein